MNYYREPELVEDMSFKICTQLLNTPRGLPEYQREHTSSKDQNLVSLEFDEDPDTDMLYVDSEVSWIICNTDSDKVLTGIFFFFKQLTCH